MAHWGGRTWARLVALGYAESAAGITVAAAVSSRVSVTIAGVLGAAAVLTAFAVISLATLRIASRHTDKVRPIRTWLFLATPALYVAGLLIAARVVPGFDVDGAWGYVVLLVCLFGASQALDWIANRISPLDPENG